MAHMSVEALICPLQGILSIAQREGISSAHSKVLLLRAYLKVIFHENIVFSFILGSNGPN